MTQDQINVSLFDEVKRLQAHCDLMLDELKRIECLTNNREIIGICRRAREITHQRVPVIVQRDQAVAEAADLRAQIARKDELIAAYQEQALEDGHE